MRTSFVYQSMVAVILSAFLVINCGCPGPIDPEVGDPPPPIPKGTPCGSVVIACYNEFAHMPANLICFRPTSRWDKIDLTWQLVNPLPGIDPLDQEEEVERAFKSWSDFSALTFSQVASDADIVISFVTLIHGDDFPFEDDGPIIGHAYFPGSPEPGDIHLNNSKSWALMPAAEQIDMYTVALHEIGHALGLEHSLNPDAIMAPVYVADGHTNITNIDVEAIRRLYGSEDGKIPPVSNNTPENFCTPPNLTMMGDPDSDEDGIPDTYEVFVLGTNPFLTDSDDDG